ncbi:MAG: hypothetical protein IJX95_01500, partial [Lachnospiraceae bacterium]|nr:hypothetical protein [Lachnospiraceae bacterium]
MSDNKMIRFLWTTILLAGLCVLAGFHAEYFMGCLLCGAALIVVFQIQSLTDTQSRSSLVIQGILSLLFSLVAGHFAAYLIFYEMRGIGRKKKERTEERVGPIHGREEGMMFLRVVLPGVFCFFVTLLRWLIIGESAEKLPELLWYVLLLTACAAVLLAV